MYYFWFRRDLRLNDNAGLYHALKEAKESGKKVQCLFIFDTNILDELPDKEDARVHFIHNAIAGLHESLEKHGSGLAVHHGNPIEVWKQIAETSPVEKVFANRDYEPYATQRDQSVKELVIQQGGEWADFKDHVVFEADEVLKSDGTPYTVFTPYSRKWMEKLRSETDVDGNSFYLKSYPVEQYLKHLNPSASEKLASLEALGFQPSSIEFPSKEVAQGLIRQYDKTRNFPATPGTSRLGVHFRFGTISIREKARKAQNLNAVFLNELIWRDFYSQILSHFPRVVSESFRPQYDQIPWRNNQEEFEAWKAGKTGYPIVDAGMRELSQTGYMHNRVRMITASFLTKHLLIDWRWGEAWFAQKLLDYDLASNNGGWQWASGSGTDAAPYFRIFNPESQQKKFDKDLKYIKKWVPEFGTDEYPEPIVDHSFARERCLKTYKENLG